MFNYKITLEYNGADFKGSQAQNGSVTGRTVQSELEQCLSRFFGQEIKCNFAGRTDAGVHALGQVVNFNLSKSLDEVKANPSKLLISANAFLPDDMVISDIQEVSMDFHARHSAKSREYLYKIFVRRHRPVLRLDSLMWQKEPLDFDLMLKHAQTYIGTHDFERFAKTENGEDATCTVYESELVKESSVCIKYRVKANRFLRHMVRRMVGELIQIGTGQDLDRETSLQTVPAQGLTLMKVHY